MTSAKAAKQAGLSSLVQASRMINKSVQTLDNWHKDNKALFDIVILGCLEKLKQENVK